jgi:hypothetical protein
MKTLHTPLAALAAAALAALPSLAAATSYTYTEVTDPNALTTALIAVNDDGKVVGVERDPVTTLHHALVGTRDGVARLDPDGVIGQAYESWSYTVNNHGDIGGAMADDTGVQHGYLRHVDGTVETVMYPGAIDTYVFGVNDLGDMIGQYAGADGINHAWVRRRGHFSNIDLAGALTTVPLSIDDSGLIVGEWIDDANNLGKGFLLHPDGRFSLHEDPGAAPDQTYWISLNNRKQVLGSYFDADGNFLNFVRRGGQDVPFALPAAWGSVFTVAETINDYGDVVGYFVDGANTLHGFYAAAHGDRRP